MGAPEPEATPPSGRGSPYHHTHIASSPMYRPAPLPPHATNGVNASPGSSSASRRPAPPPPQQMSDNPFEQPSRYLTPPHHTRSISTPQAFPSGPWSDPRPRVPLTPGHSFDGKQRTVSASPYGESSSPKESSKLKKLRPWSLAGGGKKGSGWSDKSSGSGSDRSRGRDGSPSPYSNDSNGENEEDNDLTLKLGDGFSELKIKTSEEALQRATWKGKEKEIESASSDWCHLDYADAETDEDMQPDAYSWVDPSLVGSDKLRRTPKRSIKSAPSSPGGTTSRSIVTTVSGDQSSFKLPETPKVKPHIDPADSYKMLIAYQTSSSGHESISPLLRSPLLSPAQSTEAVHKSNADPQWHMLVDASVMDSLEKSEVKRQGLWWELMNGEVEYVRDLRTICNSFIYQLRNKRPPLIHPESRLDYFVDEVFSTAPALREAHEKLLLKLLERQRQEWPLITSAADLLLEHFLESVDLYETYMKNYPFAEARVKRERQRNAGFRSFIEERNSVELSRKRDLFVFLSRPMSRLTRILMQLKALLSTTPPGHSDHEEIPTVCLILENTVKASQPGIESAEAKINLWNVAERLMFRKGETTELDIAEPKRTLVYSGLVFRRVRSETNWHGWQNLHAFLLDNYFILTRDEENGGHVVVSRPIHIDFLKLLAVDSTPERRYDYLAHVRRHASSKGHAAADQFEHLMYPLTIASTAGSFPRTYTLCVESESARTRWKEKIESALMLRKFDLEGNKTFAIHTIFVPPVVKEPIVAADAFSWLGRETIAVATTRSVWLGLRRDSRSYRELVSFSAGIISSISIVPDFGWLLVLVSGSLVAFSLEELVPTHEPSTWQPKSRGGGYDLSGNDQPTAFVRVGVTKGRTMVVHAAFAKSAHQTVLTFEEPLLASNTDRHYATTPFRRFATLTVPGFATDLSFFRQTVAVVAEKGFIIAEAGNPTFNSIPTVPPSVQQDSALLKMLNGARAMGMYQIGENEFMLAYDWGACFVTKFGEVARHGSFVRWNVTPTYIAFRSPHLLLFDEIGGRAEIRDVIKGKIAEVLHERGLKALRLSRADQPMLGISPRGLLEVVETQLLHPTVIS